VKLQQEDSIRIVSLLLYYSCVSNISQFFQQCSKDLDSKIQPTVLQFLEASEVSDKKEPITEDIVRAAIYEASPEKLIPHLKFICSSQIRTPDKAPPTPTPSEMISHEKLMELQRAKTQLANECYERYEGELKESEEKIQQLRKSPLTSYSNQYFMFSELHESRKGFLRKIEEIRTRTAEVRS
jgi:hypothetical protein